MRLTDEQWKEINNKLGKYFLDYSIVYSKNVVMRYVTSGVLTPSIAKAKETPNTTEFMHILTDED